MIEKIHVLHLEDNDRDAELVASFLDADSLSCEITRVDSMGSFTDALASEKFDLILSDYSIPGFSGLEALCMASKQVPEIPFIFVSGTMGEESAVDSLHHGATDYVLKQRPMRLAAAIRRAIAESELKKQQAVVHETQRFQSTILRNVTDAVIATDIHKNVIYWNQAASSMFGLSYEEAIGVGVAALSLNVEKENIVQLLEEAARENEAVAEFRYEEYQEGARWAAAKVSRMFGEDDVPLGFLLILKDVSERKKAEEALVRMNEELESRVDARTTELSALNEELSAFGYSLSHDLRSPVRAIKGYTRILIDEYSEGMDPEATTFLDRIEKSGVRMEHLIESLLRFASQTASGMERAEVNLSQLTHLVIQDLSDQNPTRAIEWQIEDGLNSFVDERLIRSVLDNLLGNAVKFTIDQSPAIIEFGRIWVDEVATFFVRDNGIGFDQKYAETIFQTFKRLHGPDEFPGVGVGLSTAHRIVQRHGGRLWAEGSPGKGAVFFFTIG